MNSNDPKDGAERRERAVAEGDERREKAVEHARKVGGAVGLAEAPVSADAPPHYPAPPYPRRPLKETLPSTPRAIAKAVADSLPPLESLAQRTTPSEPVPSAVVPAAPAASGSTSAKSDGDPA